MNLRNVLAAALIAVSVSSASAAIETPVAIGPDFPRPMPGAIAAPPVVRNFWQMLRDLVQPKLGPAVPGERWI